MGSRTILLFDLHQEVLETHEAYSFFTRPNFEDENEFNLELAYYYFGYTNGSIPVPKILLTQNPFYAVDSTLATAAMVSSSFPASSAPSSLRP